MLEPQSAVKPNSIAASYDHVRRAGEGALFTVSLARERASGRNVAVKALKPQLARDTRFAARLVEEAQAVRKLDHPNVARVVGAAQENGTAYIVTEYVEGASLRDRIRRTAPLPVAVAVDIAVDIAEALAAAHSVGITHGDLRPHNVLITPDGLVKVTDFGLARALDDSADLQMNSVLRWVQCLSPEVAEGHAPSPASDVYSLGCILYEMLTGQPSFEGDNAIVVALKHVREQARPVRDVNPSVPRALAAVVARCMEKDPAARYPDGATMLADLRGVQNALRANKSLDYVPVHVLTPTTNPTLPEVVYEDEDTVPRSLLIFRNITLTLVGVGLVLIAYFLYSVLQPQREVIVPEVVGLDTAAATKLLQDRNLQWNVLQRESDKPAGEVLGQEPEANQPVKPGRNVQLFVSKGPKVVVVPNITEMSVDRARERAAQDGLAVKKAEYRHDENVQKGYVLDQDPSAGETVSPGKTIKVTVSLGPEPPPPAPVAPDLSNPYAAPPTGTATLPLGQQTGRPRSFNVGFQVPATGYEAPVVVQIVIVDERGEQTVADEQHNPGDKVSKRVDAVGERVHIRVYLNGRLFSEEIK